MSVFAIRIKRPNVAAVQCPHDANARHHGRAVELDNQQQGFYRGLPLLEILLGLGKLLDILGGVLEGDDLATAGQGNRIIEQPLPTVRRFQQGATARGGFQSGGMRSPRSKRRYFSAVQSR